MLKDLTTLMVYVADMDRSIAFYRDVLGLKLDMQSPYWSQFALGNGVILGLHPRRADEMKTPQGGWTPGFAVDDVVAAKTRIAASSGSVAMDLHDVPGGVILELADPDGNVIDVMQAGITCADLGVKSA
jgi:predicted enzyme related to lactoylglutathione lyase